MDAEFITYLEAPGISESEYSCCSVESKFKLIELFETKKQTGTNPTRLSIHNSFSIYSLNERICGFVIEFFTSKGYDDDDDDDD